MAKHKPKRNLGRATKRNLGHVAGHAPVHEARHGGTDWTKLLLCIIGCEIVGIIGSFFTMPALAAWYSSLNKPFFTPPDWVYGPVWGILFLLMGISFYIFLEAKARHGHAKAGPLQNMDTLVFYLQLALNLLWSVLFFGLQMPRLAFFEIVALWLCVMFNVLLFARTSRKAALLLVPYLLWVSFATGLNFTIAIMN